jgi:hypothetical protein
MRDHALKGLVTGLTLGLTITFLVGLLAVILGQLCIWPLAPWCSW